MHIKTHGEQQTKRQERTIRYMKTMKMDDTKTYWGYTHVHVYVAHENKQIQILKLNGMN